MAARVLIVEDDPSLTTLLDYNLRAEGYDITSCADGSEAALTIAEDAPDLVLLDWMLPGLSGIELCRRLRASKATRHLPVIMLTARGEEGDRVRGLEVGADDYIVKPFSVPELLARVRAMLRRSSPQRVADTLEAGDIRLDRLAHMVSRSGRDIHLGPTEYRLLEHFMQSPGRVLTRSQLLDQVWGRDSEVDERTVDVHVGRLRRALVSERRKERDPIRTVRGTGYAFGLPDEE